MSSIEKVQEDILVEEQVGINNEIVLYNDDVNTFDHVIDTLIRVCKHSSVLLAHLWQRQCAYLAHFQINASSLAVSPLKDIHEPFYNEVFRHLWSFFRKHDVRNMHSEYV